MAKVQNGSKTLIMRSYSTVDSMLILSGQYKTESVMMRQCTFATFDGRGDVFKGNVVAQIRLIIRRFLLLSRIRRNHGWHSISRPTRSFKYPTQGLSDLWGWAAGLAPPATAPAKRGGVSLPDISGQLL